MHDDRCEGSFDYAQDDVYRRWRTVINRWAAMGGNPKLVWGWEAIVAPIAATPASVNDGQVPILLTELAEAPITD